MDPPPNPPVRLPTQLLIDLFGFGSGMGESLAEIVGRQQRSDALSVRNAAIALARHGRHWLGPRALNELLAIATDATDEGAARQNALGALARAVRAWRHPRASARDNSPVDQPAESIIRQGRLLLNHELRANPGWTGYPAFVTVQPNAHLDGGSRLPRLAWAKVNETISLQSCLDRMDLAISEAEPPQLPLQFLSRHGDPRALELQGPTV